MTRKMVMAYDAPLKTKRAFGNVYDNIIDNIIDNIYDNIIDNIYDNIIDNICCRRLRLPCTERRGEIRLPAIESPVGT